ncbi:conserved hypothetical protein [Chelatococcus asaccharovorans]|nr:conserved hypothetical protein [Chelatococcus asaccharovorans]
MRSGCVKRRSTFTTIVLSCLSLTTTPCNTRFGTAASSNLGRFSELLLLKSLDASDVATHHPHAVRALKLARGTLKAQVELLLLQLQKLVLELIGRHSGEVGKTLFRFHRLTLTPQCAE